GGIVNYSGKFGGINISGSQVGNNKLTNAETLGGTVGTFLSLIKSPALRKFAVVVDGPGGAQMQSALAQAAKRGSQTAKLLQQALSQNPAAARALVAGGGIAAPLNCPITIASGAQVTGNISGVSANGKPATGIGGGLFAFRSPITINGGLISSNTATSAGGGG